LVAKDCEDKEERLRRAHEADREERSHAVAALRTEAAKEQDEILENTRATRSFAPRMCEFSPVCRGGVCRGSVCRGGICSGVCDDSSLVRAPGNDTTEST
jgi:hypothetical protein